MTDFPLFFTPLSIVLLAVAFLAAVWALCFGWNAARLTARAPLPLTPENLEDNYFSLDAPSEPDSDETPRLSVVLYITDISINLDEVFQRLSEQRALWRYEIIAVCNASARETMGLAERFARFKGIRFTFIPPESKNLSRRKLAYTVGIKAPAGEAVLLTAPNMIPSSTGWFQLMAEPILNNPETNIAIGTTRFDFQAMGSGSRLFRSFLWVTDKIQSLGAALAGAPYRGDWGNLAMRRSFFFDCKGYGSTISIETGDDDIFIARETSGTDTEVVLAPAAMPIADWGEWTNSIWKEQRLAYDFTSRLLPRRPFVIKGALSLCNWIVVLCSIAAALAPGLPLLANHAPTGPMPPFSWLPAISAGVMLFAFEVIQMIFYRNAATRLMMPSINLLLPFFYLWRPIDNLLFRQSHSVALRRNYTWQH